MFKLRGILGRLLILGMMFGVLLSGRSLSGGAAAPLESDPQEASQLCPLSGTAGLCGSSTTSVLNMPPAAPSSSGSDSYGYTFKDSNEVLNPPAFDWKNARQNGTRLFPKPPKDIGQDEYSGVSDPIVLPFSFKFYEQTYSKVYVDVEGVIGFSPTLTDTVSHFENLAMPSEIPPQALIAPFWDNLLVKGTFNSTVYYTSTASYFAVQWSAVTTSITQSVPLTFEVVLYPDNSIGFYYQEMDSTFDSATVGIEDGDGVVGLQYLYNAPGLSDGLAIKFFPPLADAYRAKAFPKLQGGLNIARESIFKVNLRNSGDFNDSYNLVVNSTWPEYALYKADGISPLSGNNTGTMTPGELMTVTLKVKAPAGAGVGSNTLIELVAVSVGSGLTKSSDVEMRTMLPAPFAMTVLEGSFLHTDLVSRHNWHTAVEYAYQTTAGGRFAVSAASNNNFVGVWYQSVEDDKRIHYLLFDSVGTPLFSPSKSLSPADVEDQNPVVATAPNGNIAIAWERDQRKVDSSYRENVMFQLLDPNGNPLLAQPITVTNNVTYTYGFEDDYLRYDNIRLEATSDNRFVLVWVQKQNNVGGGSLTTVDVGRAIYSAINGSQVLAPGLVFAWIPDGIHYDLPGLVFFREKTTNNPRLLLPYLYSSPGLEKISYVVLNTSGSIVSGPSDLSVELGYGLDGVQLSDGNLALVWIDTHLSSPHVNLVRMKQDLTQFVEVSLPLPDGRPAATASVTADGAGNAIITWMDYKWQQRLYYAQATFADGLVGQPLILQAINTAVGLNASDLTQGLAPYSPWWRLLLPLLRR